MVVNVREKSFNDKNDKNKVVRYSEFYVTFKVFIEEEETIDLVLKIEDKFAKEMLKQNLHSASFDVVKNVKEGVCYYNPVITFVVGQSDYRIPVKLSNEALVLARIGLVE